MGNVHEHQCTFFFIITRSVLLRARNVPNKRTENQHTHFVFNNFFFFDNRAVYEIMWKNVVEPEGPQMTTRRMRIACWVPKATNTQSEYVILMLHYTYEYIACLVRYLYRSQMSYVGNAEEFLNVKHDGTT